jgi:FKBP-type peptidyl-prolyl cis-trans isomerase FklB
MIFNWFKIFFICSLAMLILSCSSSTENVENVSLKNKIDTASYIIGLDYGISIKAEEIEVNDKAIYKGLLDGLNGKSLISDSLKDQIIDRYNTELNNRRAEKEKKLLEKNKADGLAFMAINKSNEGVFELPNGLQYKILKEGIGNVAGENDIVKIHYRAMFIDRSVFDMTYDRGPAAVKLNELVPGLSQGIRLLNTGSIYELYIPPELAYGDQTFADVIPAGSTLIYSIELIEIIRENKK